MQPRIIFMGTPEFAVPALKEVAKRFGSENLLVVTQPDRTAGRGRKVQPPPVKAAASAIGLDVLQVSTLRDAEARAKLEAYAPDLIAVAAFGLLLPGWLLRLPPRGCVNLHASLLPRFRGASPVAAAIACGDSRTGVCLMEMEAGLDTGGVYAVSDLEILPTDTTASLTERLARSAADLLASHMEDLLGGALAPVPQRGRVYETRKIVKDHGAIDWTSTAEQIERHVRAMWPWPRAWTSSDGMRIQVHAATEVGAGATHQPGTVLRHDGEIVVATGRGGLRLDTVQMPGKPARAATDLAQHPALSEAARLGYPEGFEAPGPWIVEGSDV